MNNEVKTTAIIDLIVNDKQLKKSLQNGVMNFKKYSREVADGISTVTEKAYADKEGNLKKRITTSFKKTNSKVIDEENKFYKELQNTKKFNQKEDMKYETWKQNVVKSDIDNIKRQANETTNNLKKMRHAALFSGLGFLFMGMSIKNSMQSIMRSSFATFKKIDQGQSEAAVGTAALTAEFEYLKYSVGKAISEALLPMLPTILSLVRSFSNLVKDNPTAVFATIIGLFAAGTTMMAIGQLSTFVSGMSTLGDLFSGTKLDNGKTKLDSVAAGAQKLAGIGAIVLSVKFAIDAAEDLFDEKWASGFVKAIGAAFTAYGGIRLLQGKKGGLPLILIGVGFEWLGEATLFTKVAKIFSPILAAIDTWFKYLIKDLRGGWANMLKGFVVDSVNMLVGWLGNKLFKQIFGKSAGNMVGDAIGFEEQPFDWGYEFKQSIQGFNNAAAILDGKVSKIMNTDFPTRTEALQNSPWLSSPTSSMASYDTDNRKNTYIINVNAPNSNPQMVANSALDGLKRLTNSTS